MLQTAEYNEGRESGQKLKLSLTFFLPPFPNTLYQPMEDYTAGLGVEKQSVFRAGAPVAQHGWRRCANQEEERIKITRCTLRDNLLFPKRVVEAVGAFPDGDVPAAVVRPRLDRSHRGFGCDP